MQQSGTASSTREVRKVAISGLLGTTLEFYDFLLYGTLAALVFDKLFFPDLSPIVGTIAAFGTFTAGYLARPLGGILFGHFGDRMGRKSMLLLTMTMMGTASFLIGLLPTYATIGVWAPILLTVLRTVQGIAIGGEWGGAVLMTAEHSGTRRRGFWSSFTVMGAPLGSLLSTVVVMVVVALPEDDFLAWGWRVPFLFSIVLLGVGMFVRLRVAESPVFAQAMRQSADKPARRRIPLVEILRRPRNLVLTTGIGLGPLVIQALWSTFLITYAVRAGHAESFVLLGLAVGSALQLFALPAVAAVSDRVGRRPTMLAGALATIAMAFPLFWMIDSGSGVWLMVALVLGRSVLQPLTYAPWPAVMAESFGTENRYTGASLGYQLSSMIGGGFAPLIAASLLAAGGGETTYVALFLMGASVATAVAVWLIRETRHVDLAGDPAGTPATRAVR
ncbi:MFS transporter [Prauserella muralis]|uniref:Putative proline/betaine transporter n=1 Tax=Prauserella muralis TaxID=588067 RepID=A0A2V4B0N1_9PSEU|nr:MFS transporter [Prauserella muralis]PXY27754.1 MFS transporter [Prauserella muralis]TWE22493.1 MFS transporter [Prauserella muralis]